MTLLADVNRPGSQEDLVSSWELAHSLIEDAISGVEIAPCLLALAAARQPLCLLWREGLVQSQLALLWYLLSPLFCEQALQCLRLELFTGKFSLSLFCFLSLSLAIPQFGSLSHISSLRLSSGHSSPILTLSNAAHASVFSLYLLVAVMSVWATFLLGVAVRHVICGFYLFIYFFLPVMLLSEIQNSPQTHP